MSDIVILQGSGNLDEYKKCTTNEEKHNTDVYKNIKAKMIRKDGLSVFKRNVETARIAAAITYNNPNKRAVSYIEFSTCVVLFETPEHGTTPDSEVNSQHCDFSTTDDEEFIQFLDDLSNNISRGGKISVSEMEKYWHEYDK